jgi:hypothetical protein
MSMMSMIEREREKKRKEKKRKEKKRKEKKRKEKKREEKKKALYDIDAFFSSYSLFAVRESIAIEFQ